MHNFTRLAIANRHNAAAGLANIYISLYGNLDDDPDANEPPLSSRINKRVPMLRISDPKDDVYKKRCEGLPHVGSLHACHVRSE